MTPPSELKRESGGRIVHDDGRGWPERRKQLASTTKPYSHSEPYATLVNLKTRSA
jgi:hypothetical protein